MKSKYIYVKTRKWSVSTFKIFLRFLEFWRFYFSLVMSRIMWTGTEEGFVHRSSTRFIVKEIKTLSLYLHFIRRKSSDNNCANRFNHSPLLYVRFLFSTRRKFIKKKTLLNTTSSCGLRLTYPVVCPGIFYGGGMS